MARYIPLPEVPGLLKKLGVKATYQQVYRAALNGDIPAERRRNARWYIVETNMKQVAKALSKTRDV